MGSAAVMIPQLNVAFASPRQPRLPIASLTKLMVVWVVLHRFPLGITGRGVCETVTVGDVTMYRHDVAQGQSVAKIVRGQNICERTLLRGIIVHSAGDYAQLLAQLTGLTLTSFVGVMNDNAAALSMDHTHYVDETGISSGDVSTAFDQAVITAALMKSEPAVRAAATLPWIRLPVQGVVGTFTPDLGYDGVVGVKSGYTGAAGGCDAMAVNLRLGSNVITTYVVVLGQKSGNALALAGQVALALYHSIRPSIARVRTASGVRVEWIGTPADIVTPSASAS